MRKNFLILMLLALLPLASFAAAIPDGTYKGANTHLRFNAIVSGTGTVFEAEILGFVNGGDVAELEIPATVEYAPLDGGEVKSFKVVKVVENAFKDNTTITSVAFNSPYLTRIENAFNGCTNLASVDFTKATELTTIDEGAFTGTKILALDLSKTKVATVNELLKATAKAKNNTLASVSLPKTVTSIVAGAFQNCSALKDLTFAAADAAATIGAGAFAGTIIETLDLEPTKVATINNLFGTTFAGTPVANTTLKTVKLPNTWTNIVESAFENCTALETISLKPASGNAAAGQAIATKAFNGTAITDLDFTNTTVTVLPVALLMDGVNVEYNESLETVTLTKDFTVLNGSLAACVALTAVNNLDKAAAITGLADDEFAGDLLLATINTKNIKTFGARAFAACASLTSVDLTAATTFDEYTFTATGLTSVSIPKAVPTIPEGCFYACEDLATVTFADDYATFTKIGEYAFAYTAIAEITIPACLPRLSVVAKIWRSSLSILP